MIFGYCLLLVIGGVVSLSPADVTYVEGKAPEDLKAGPDSKSALFGSGSIQTKGFSASFNQGEQDSFSSTTTARTSTESSSPTQPWKPSQPRNEKFSAKVVYPSSTTRNSESVSYANSSPRSEKVVYYSTAAPKTQRIIYDSTLSSAPRNQKVGYYSASSTSSPRSQKFTDSYYSTGAPAYGYGFVQNSGVQYSTPQYQPSPAILATVNKQTPFIRDYQPIYQTSNSERVIPIYEPSQEYNQRQSINTSYEQNNFAPKATIQVPYVSQRQEVQAHNQGGSDDDDDQQQGIEYEQSEDNQQNFQGQQDDTTDQGYQLQGNSFQTQGNNFQSNYQPQNTQQTNYQAQNIQPQSTDYQPQPNFQPQDTQQTNYQAQDTQSGFQPQSNFQPQQPGYQPQPRLQPQQPGYQPQQPNFQPQNTQQTNYQDQNIQPQQPHYQPQDAQFQPPSVVAKKVNVVTPVVRKTTFEIRKPAVEKQFFDIEERVVVRPAGTVVVELDGPVSKISKGQTITDIGQGRIAPSQTPQFEGGVTYASSPSPRPEVTYNGESGYSSASPSPDYDDSDDSSVQPQYSTTTQRTLPTDRNLISPQMISVGDPDFTKPPYVEGGDQQQPAQQSDNYRVQAGNRNLYFGKQTQYVPVAYNQNGRAANAKQVLYSQSVPCEQGQGFAGQRGYVGGNPLYTYFQVQSPGVSFRTYNNRGPPKPQATLPPPPEEGEVEEIDVNKEEFQNKGGRLRNNYNYQQQSGRLTETDNAKIYNDLLNRNNSTTFNISDGSVGPGERVISATPAPLGSKPASQTVQTRRIVVNHPFETVRVVEEEEQQAKVQEVTVNQRPTRLFKTSSSSSVTPSSRLVYRQPVYQQYYYNGYPAGNYYRSIRK